MNFKKKKVLKQRGRKKCRVWIIEYKNQWYDLDEIILLEEFKDLNLNRNTLILRIQHGDTAISRLMRPKQSNQRPETDLTEKEAREGCTEEEWDALKTGSNKALLACS